MSPSKAPGPVSATRLFQWLRWRRLRHNVRDLFGHSSMRPLTILLCCLVIWTFVFLVSLEGLTFVRDKQTFPVLGGIMGTVFDVLFFTLSVMLIFSTGIILYGSLFSTSETPFLLSTPISSDRVLAYKFQGAIAFSSSAFLLLGSPILLAFGIVTDASWHFYPVTLAFFLGFVLLPGSMGAILCLLLTNFLPQRRKQVVIFAITLLSLVVIVGTYVFLGSLRQGSFQANEVEQLLGRFEFATSTFVPSHWVGWGLISLARGDWDRVLYYLALIWSNGLFLYLVTVWLSSKLYRRAYNRLATTTSGKRSYGDCWLDRVLERALFFVEPRMRLLIVKDFQTFRRDPAQCLQLVLFVGLMCLYFLNVRRVFVYDIGWGYQNGISAINLLATSFLMCAYQGRFVFPLISLEGRKFWILGLLPLPRDKILWSKFAFAATGALIISESLILISDVVLSMPVSAILLHVLTVAVLAVGLSGISVGLGATIPNFRETDASKIAVGFGGTVNLVVCLGYVLVVLGLMTGPWHVLAATRGSPTFGLFGIILAMLGVVAGLVVGTIAVIVPLRMGAKSLREMEM